MKTINICLLLVLLFSTFNSFAQKEAPSYGKIDKADLEMKDCDFDPGAVAVKLLYIGSMFYDRGTAGITLFKTIYDYRIRIKILKDKGLSYANVDIPFFNNGVNNDEKIKQVDACVYNLDESGNVKVTNVSKSSIYTKKINKRYSRLIIAFPDTKVGSVVEYRYRLEVESYNHLKDWYFQDVIPTRYSEYEMKVPDLFVFNIQQAVVDKLEEKQKFYDDVITFDDRNFTTESQTIRFKTTQRNFIMRKLIGIKDEPFMSSAKDYLQRLEFQLSQIDYGNNHVENLRTTWNDVTTELLKDPDFGDQLKKDIDGIGSLLKDAALLADNDARIKFIFNSIRSGMRCDDHEALFTHEGVNNVWQKKTGNIADINLLLVNILNKAGIKAFPILVSSRDNGMINSTYPSLRQFNKVMVYVPLDKNDSYILDASDKFSYYKIPPASIVNTRAFIIESDRGTGKVFDIIDEKHNYQVMAALKAVIDDKGTMTGECAVNSMDYARRECMESYTEDPAAFKQAHFIKPYPSVTIQEISIKNSEYDSLPFAQKINFTTTLNNSGEYSYFTTNLFNGFEKNPFVEDLRYTDIDFGYRHDHTFYENFTIPEGYKYETLPENISMEIPDKSASYTRFMEVKENVLNVMITIKFRNSFYSAASYPDFHEFYKKLLASLNEQVVIKKK